MRNMISVSSAPIAKLGGRRYYDLAGTLVVMKKVFRESVVDGFELQLQPEWDRENPPLTDAQFADWTKTPRYAVGDILTIFKKQNLPILSVHASRDVGTYLCSNRKQDSEKGRQLIHDSLSLANDLGAEVCVLHLWDTWKTKFDWHKLKKDLLYVAPRFPRVKASVENIPIHLEGHTPFSLVKHFDHVTLDLKWASLYNELSRFESVIDKIVNVHLRGRLREDRWVLDDSSFGFYEALDLIRKDWAYQGLLTVEPEGERNVTLFNSFLKAMKSLRTESDSSKRTR
jgi:sugar phosphate isomerase/epimerase